MKDTWRAGDSIIIQAWGNLVGRIWEIEKYVGVCLIPLYLQVFFLLTQKQTGKGEKSK